MFDGAEKLAFLLKLDQVAIIVLTNTVKQFSSTGQLATLGLTELAIGTNTKHFIMVDLQNLTQQPLQQKKGCINEILKSNKEYSLIVNKILRSVARIEYSLI